MKPCVQSAGVWSEIFASNVGVLQGQVHLPDFFLLYVNDFEVVCLKIKIRNNVRDFDLNVLMNAYDIGQFSQSVDELKY